MVSLLQSRSILQVFPVISSSKNNTSFSLALVSLISKWLDFILARLMILYIQAPIFKFINLNIMKTSNMTRMYIFYIQHFGTLSQICIKHRPQVAQWVSRFAHKVSPVRAQLPRLIMLRTYPNMTLAIEWGVEPQLRVSHT